MNNLFKREVNKFRLWAKDYVQEPRSGEWECDYPDWSALLTAFWKLVESRELATLSAREIADLIYVIARDNESEGLIEELFLNKDLFYLLLPHVILSEEPAAKWQFAAALGEEEFEERVAEEALLKLVNDSDEYTSRRALKSLGKRKSTHTEALCKQAWATNHEYQRIMVLWVLKDIQSLELPEYLRLAIIDGREFLVQNAIKLKAI